MHWQPPCNYWHIISSITMQTSKSANVSSKYLPLWQQNQRKQKKLLLTRNSPWNSSNWNINNWNSSNWVWNSSPLQPWYSLPLQSWHQKQRRSTHSLCSHDTTAAELIIFGQWDGTTTKRVLSLSNTSLARGLVKISATWSAVGINSSFTSF